MSLSPARLVLLGLGLAATLVVGLRHRGALSPEPPAVRVAAPEPRPVTLRDGKVRDVGRPAPGRLLVVHFWATWCAPCVEEFPSFAAYWRERKDDPALDVVAVSVDADWKTVDAWLAKGKVTDVPMALDPAKKAASAFGTDKFPETWIVGPDGTVLFHSAGPLDWASKEFQGFVDSLKARVAART